jgi:hypothetical protein
VRIRARRSLPSMEALRSALEPVNQGAILLDEECVPFYANKRARDILDAASLGDVGRILERGDLAAQCMKSRGEGSNVTFIDVSKTEDGAKSLLIGFEVHECPASASGRAYLILMHDFSEWRKLDELHSRFATYLSHRMRTPLTSARNAIMILSEKDEPLDVAVRERFLDIGCRNIEKLISSFDELQKVFMIDSGEIDACRSLIRIGREVNVILAEAEKSGLIKGFKLRSADCTALTSPSRLREYVFSAAEAMAEWLGEAPFVDCSVTLDDGLEEAASPALVISLSPRGRSAEGERSLNDFLALGEPRKGLILERLAHALDGEHSAVANDSLRLRLSADPCFDRERDLVHPLHMMLERSGLENASFHLVSMRLYGAHSGAERFSRLLEANVCAHLSKDNWLVSRGDMPGRFSLFAVGASRESIGEMMESLRERFAHCCRERGEELYPAFRWEIAFSRDPNGCTDSQQRAVLEALI